MKVPTLYMTVKYIAVLQDGTQKEVSHDIGVWGVSEMQWHLEKEFGIKVGRSTVYQAKKVFTPSKFRWGKDREYMLAWANWVLNYPKSERAEFFDNEPDQLKFYQNNPVIDILIGIRKGN